MHCYLQKNGEILDLYKKRKKLQEVWEWDITLRKGVTFDSVMKCLLNNRESFKTFTASLFNGEDAIMIADEWLYLRKRVSSLQPTDEEYIDFIKIRWVAEEMETSKGARLDISSVMVGVFDEQHHHDIRYITLMSPARLQDVPIVIDPMIKFYTPSENEVALSYKMPMKTRDVFCALVREFTYYGNTFDRHLMRIGYEKLLRGSRYR